MARIFSDIDTDEYLADSANRQIVEYNRLCEIEPAPINIYDLPVGSDLQIVDDEAGMRIVDTATCDAISPRQFYVPPQYRRGGAAAGLRCSPAGAATGITAVDRSSSARPQDAAYGQPHGAGQPEEDRGQGDADDDAAGSVDGDADAGGDRVEP